ncbi:MAG: hypothetical protein RI947_2 [Candidatus Parcubacteria bacterium]|jgi:small conductance mechanosensitive channel
MSEAEYSVLFQKLTFTLSTLLFTFGLSLIIKWLIDSIFLRVKQRMVSDYLVSKTRTIRALLKNVIDAVLFLMALLIILAQWGVNIAPILTGAGILGLAFSFGSQTLVKDLIAGFFIIVEDQFNIGDKIKVDKYEGTVDKITLRLTVLKDKDENTVYIPNSQVMNVVRYKREAKLKK